MRELQELNREVGDAEKTTSFLLRVQGSEVIQSLPLRFMELTKDRCEPRLLSHPGLRQP